jgi:hypothetical protein
MTTISRPRLLFIGCLLPVAAWAALVGATFLMAATASHGSDVIAWLEYGGPSLLSFGIAVFAAMRFRAPTFWAATLLIMLCALLTIPGTLFLEAIGRNPP